MMGLHPVDLWAERFSFVIHYLKGQHYTDIISIRRATSSAKSVSERFEACGSAQKGKVICMIE